MLSQKVNVGLKRAVVLRKKTDEPCLPKQQQEDERRSKEREHNKAHTATLSAPEQPFGNFFGGNPFLAGSAQQAPSSPAAQKKKADSQVLGLYALLALLVPFFLREARSRRPGALPRARQGVRRRGLISISHACSYVLNVSPTLTRLSLWAALISISHACCYVSPTLTRLCL
jgi:hypothetical protein